MKVKVKETHRYYQKRQEAGECKELMLDERIEMLTGHESTTKMNSSSIG